MQDQNSTQLELFSGTGSEDQPQKGHRSFFGYVRAYEKAVLLVIGLFVTGVVSFSLGVEKGKRIALSAQNAHFDTALSGAARQQPAAKMAAPIRQESEAAAKDTGSGKDTGAYTIQLASYNNRVHAQREFEALKKKGFSALILSKGSYTVLCVGNFPSRENAQALLSEFKKRYKTCYIRRL